MLHLVRVSIVWHHVSSCLCMEVGHRTCLCARLRYLLQLKGDVTDPHMRGAESAHLLVHLCLPCWGAQLGEIRAATGSGGGGSRCRGGLAAVSVAAMSAQKQQIAQLERNYETMMAMMKEVEAERDDLKQQLQQATDEAEAQAAREKERDEESRTYTEAAEQLAADLQEELTAAKSAAEAAESAVAKLERESSAASSRFEAAVAQAADAADVGRRAVADELAQAKRVHREQLAKAAREASARESALAGAMSDLESECGSAEERGEALAARARERAALADKAAEGFKDEMRRSVGAERQRVAGMLYKEALQTHTLEEQERQIEEINVELADTRESLREANAAAAAAQKQFEDKCAASATYDTQLLALNAAQAKKVSYIEELDERLAVEQATREEQARLLTELQSSITQRTSKEAASATRAAEAEKALATLKQEARALRMAVRSANMKKTPVATQTERHVEGPQASVQTDFQAVHMPLPALPHGGTLLPRGK